MLKTENKCLGPFYHRRNIYASKFFSKGNMQLLGWIGFNNYLKKIQNLVLQILLFPVELQTEFQQILFALDIPVLFFSFVHKNGGLCFLFPLDSLPIW